MNQTESLQEILDSIHDSVITSDSEKVANYIPQLSGVNPNKFGMHLVTIEGNEYSVGHNDEQFSIQNITIVLLLVQAKLEIGSELKGR